MQASTWLSIAADTRARMLRYELNDDDTRIIRTHDRMFIERTMERVGTFLSGGTAVGPAKSKGLVMVHLNIFLYSLCFWVQQPVLPFLSEKLGASGTAFGALGSAMSVMALIGGAVMGRLTDTHGAKYTLIVSHTGSFVMYGLMGVATSYWVLFLSRFPALVQHAMLCAQAAITDLVPAEGRSVAMGRLSISYGLGMVIGSPSGGYLANFIGYHGAASFSAALTAAIIVADVLLLPAFTKTPTKKIDDAKNSENNKEVVGSIEQAKAFFAVLSQPRVIMLLLFIFPISMGIGGFRAILSLAGPKQFAMESKDLGIFIAFAASVGLATNVLFIGLADKYLGDFQTVFLSSAVQVLAYALYAVATSYTQIVTITIPATVCSTLFYTLSSSMMSFAVDKNNTGSAIAISHGSRSFVGIIAPLLAGYIYDKQGFYTLSMCCAVCCAVSAAVAQTVSKSTLLELQRRKLKNKLELEESKKNK